LLGTKPSQSALDQCDTLLIVGSSFPYVEFMPRLGKAHGIQIDIDPRRIGLRYPVEVGLVGDCRLSLEELLPLLHRQEDRGVLKKAQEGMAEWRTHLRKQETRSDVLNTAKQLGFRFDTVQMPLNVMDAHFRSFQTQVLPVSCQRKHWCAWE
jgi:thiamine pyrophosphate-dependent acetolactate synthase large subunit-like protein